MKTILQSIIKDTIHPTVNSDKMNVYLNQIAEMVYSMTT